MMTPIQQSDGGGDPQAQATGRRFWRSLEELADTAEFREYLHREFPKEASEWHDEASRRQFLRLMGASIALAGVSGCAFQKPESIVPYVRQPEELIPGKPLFYATSMTLGGYAVGLLVESHEGRPTKIEGNDKHPASLGATSAFAQASVLNLYDPDRSQSVLRSGRISTWDAFLGDLTRELDAIRARKGAGLRILTETVGSPTLADQIAKLREQLPEARWHQYEPAGADAARAGARMAFGRDVEAVYAFDKADVLVSLDSDVLTCGPAELSYARQFASRREVLVGRDAMNRFYAAESTPTGTGAVADHRISVRARDVDGLARAIAAKLGVAGIEAPSLADPEQARWVDAAAADLQQARGKGLIVVGDGQPAAVHALAHAINQTLGNVGQTVVFIDPVVAEPGDQLASLRELVRDMQAGTVTTLLILGGNPSYSAPVDLDFNKALDKVALRIHLGTHQDETAARCHWHIPEAHALEAWGDGRAFDGTATLQQPLIAPLYGGKSALELLAVLQGNTAPLGYEILRNYWRGRDLPGDFEKTWRAALHEGLFADTASAPVEVELQPLPAEATRPPARGEGLEVIFRPDPTIHDGRFANNGWLQELPKPLTKLTWDNAALMSPKTAGELDLRDEEVVELEYRGRKVKAPVLLVPNHADDSVTLHLGYGRAVVGRVGTGAGFDAYALRTSEAPGFDSGLKINKTSERRALARTQKHRSLEGRHLVQVGTLEQYRQDPHSVLEGIHELPADHTLYPPYDYSKDNAWGMAINLGTCTGCNACVVACQAENNIPVVGKDQVIAGRELHWLEIDTYYESRGSEFGDPEPNRPDATHFQPRLCMHCENAPCEVVCPVAATVHDSEGLNNMIYNRCVGTRYCSNNCPYKVRHFNFLEYADSTTPVLKLLNNPDVTVRSRGIMEKCTFCVQRIAQVRIDAKREDRPIRDGDVKTACQAACPTRAIVFGDINDRESEVAKLKAQPINYSMLGELNTRPRTTYLAKLNNPNPALAARPEEAADGNHAS